MKTQSRIRAIHAVTFTAAAVALAAPGAGAQSAEEFRQLKALVEQLQRTVEAQNARIAEMEKSTAAPTVPSTLAPTPAPAPATPAVRDLASSPSVKTLERIAAGEPVGGEASAVKYRGALNDRQEAASRPRDYTLDPSYRGFIPVPNTPILLKFNAKPRLDITYDNENPGSIYRFAPAKFPLETDSTFGGGGQANVNANGTQLRFDARAPDLPGNLRFYYQSDFFGSDDADMRYRLQHLYGQFYGVKAGFTYGVWEDPDVWPDTVDYEGPNSVIFARRPVAQYTQSWNENWNTTFGVEKPDTYVDVNSGGNTDGQRLTRVPDIGFNTRFEKEGFGHLQFSTILRELGAQDDAGHDHHVMGWGVNLSAGIDLTDSDSLQLLGVYGEGVGGMGNDASFLNSDAAFDTEGSLEALGYWSAMVGFTHRWSDQFRSTATYGYVNIDNTAGQAETFYHTSHYASANIIWQLRQRLSIGLEGLYGIKEARNGVDSGDHWRIQVGLVYSIFD
ncbi:MAG: DcaP family trimeric outer membrane transporter [Limisphaerales bacterium]